MSSRPRPPRRPSPRPSISQRPPCIEHGLATGPDGRCTLCKRSQPPSAFPTAPEPEQSLGARLTTSLLGIGALISICVALAIALGMIQLRGASPPAPEPVGAPVVAPAPRELAPVPPPPARVTPSPVAPKVPRRPVPERFDSSPRPSP